MTDETAPQWRIVLEPHGDNPGTNSEPPESKGRKKKNKDEDYDGINESAMIIHLADPRGKPRQEISRVGFERKHSINPNVSFKDQMDMEISKARVAVDLLNNELIGSGELV